MSWSLTVLRFMSVLRLHTGNTPLGPRRLSTTREACVNLCWTRASGHKFFRAQSVCWGVCRVGVVAAGTSELSLCRYISQTSRCLAGIVPSCSGVWTSPAQWP